MNNSIFRKKSLDKATSPEELNDYMRVTSPGVWLVMAAVILLLIGMLTWGIFGTIRTQDETGAEKEVHPITYVVN